MKKLKYNTEIKIKNKTEKIEKKPNLKYILN